MKIYKIRRRRDLKFWSYKTGWGRYGHMYIKFKSAMDACKHMGNELDYEIVEYKLVEGRVV